MRDSVEAAYIGALRLWYIPLIFKLEVNDVIKDTFVKTIFAQNSFGGDCEEAK